MAEAWRMLEHYEERIYDDDVPPNGEPGYLLQVRLQSPPQLRKVYLLA